MEVLRQQHPAKNIPSLAKVLLRIHPFISRDVRLDLRNWFLNEFLCPTPMVQRALLPKCSEVFLMPNEGKHLEMTGYNVTMAPTVE